MQEQPNTEHQWLHKLIGEWTCESECSMGPDQPPMKSTGKETVRSLGGFWTIGEGVMDGDAGGGQAIMTLGFSPVKKKFVGTFVMSMMSHLWLYEGTLDASGKVLELDSEGPSFVDDGTIAKYRDTIEFIQDDHRVLSSRILMPDGAWTPFMTAHYHRLQ